MAFLDVLYEVRKIKLHIMDMQNNPERHDFSKNEYSKHELEEKCITCWEDNKHKFESDFCTKTIVRTRIANDR